MASIISAGTTSGTALNMSGDTTGILQLATNGTTTAMTISTAQNVGIGTASPASKLDIVGSADILGLTNTSGSSYESINMTVGTQTARIVLTGQSFTDVNYGTGDLTIQAQTAGKGIRFGTGGSTNQMRIDSSGYVTMPYQPCFLAYRTTTQTGTSPFTILFDTAPVNVGSGYSTSTGRFTAPVTGNYHFTFQTIGLATTWSTFDVFSYKNGASTPTILSTRPTSTSGADNASALSTSVGICNLTAGDYIEMKASNTSIYSDGNAWLKFMGFLIG